MKDRGIARLAGAGLVSLAALAVALLFAPTASANPIASGSTALTLGSATVKAVAR